MNQDHSAHILQSQLAEYAAQDLYPFHMPGHKRRMEPAPGLPYTWDVTEVPGTDDLHDAKGILREAMERTAQLWGADRTWYLVNGSTCGLLAGIRALARPGSEVLCARNCHKAVYHALELSGYRVHWILPPVDPAWGICGGISAQQVKAALRRHPGAQALILTSPTYEGVLSEIREICGLCHDRDIPVLVDEAQGAHLMPLSEKAGFPEGALVCGADVVVQSPHKTLPSLTQTALLHLQGRLVEAERIEEALDLFETSSPSYPLLASLDGCTGILRERGEELFEQWSLRIGRFDVETSGLQRVRILRAAGQDPGRILIDARAAGLSGRALADILRTRYRMETEMASDITCLVLTSLCDDEDALDRLARALRELDAEDAAPAEKEGQAGPDAKSAEKGAPAGPDTKTAEKEAPADENRKPWGKDALAAGEEAASLFSALASLRPAAVCPACEAAAQASEEVPLERAEGRICAEYLYFYPPGVPFLAPGELVTGEHCRLLACAGAEGLVPCRKTAESGIRCLCE